jgi:hypothetical protein
MINKSNMPDGSGNCATVIMDSPGFRNICCVASPGILRRLRSCEIQSVDHAFELSDAIERGKVSLTIATLRKIARNLDTTIAALLKGIL